MNDQTQPSGYLVLSRGQWDKDAAPADIQVAIDGEPGSECLLFEVVGDNCSDLGVQELGKSVREQ